MAAAANQAAPVVRIARGVALDGGSAGLQIHHVGDGIHRRFLGVEAAFYYYIAVTFVLFGVSEVSSSAKGDSTEADWARCRRSVSQSRFSLEVAEPSARSGVCREAATS